MIKKYRKKPVVIEAMLYDGKNGLDVLKWIMENGGQANTYNGVHIETLEGVVTASKGDYVIRGVKGEFYPCKPDIFRETYEEVSNE